MSGNERATHCGSAVSGAAHMKRPSSRCSPRVFWLSLVLVQPMLLPAARADDVAEIAHITELGQQGEKAVATKDYPSAERAYREALAAAEKSSPPRVPFILNRLNEVLRAQHRLIEAESIGRKSVELADRLFPPLSFQAFDAHLNLALAVVEQGKQRWPEARPLLVSAADVLDQFTAKDLGEDTLAQNRQLLGVKFSLMEDYDRGAAYLNQSLPYFRKLRAGAGRPSIGEGEFYLGMKDYSRNENAFGEAHFRSSLKIYLRDAPKSKTAMGSYFMLGRSLWSQRRLPEAEVELRRAVELARLVEDSQEKRSLAILSLGGVLAEQRQWAEAKTLTDEAYTLASTAPEYDPTELAQASTFGGMAYRGLGDNQGAIERFRRAVKIYGDYPDQSAMRAFAAGHLAEVLWAQDRLCEAAVAYRVVIEESGKQKTSAAEADIEEAQKRLREISEEHICFAWRSGAAALIGG
jgi:tetratricopeptide (TPR) repeat protein